MAIKKNGLLSWMKRYRVTQQKLSDETGIKQALISAYCNGKKVSDNSMCLFADTQGKTEIPNSVLNEIKNQHL